MIDVSFLLTMLWLDFSGIVNFASICLDNLINVMVNSDVVYHGEATRLGKITIRTRKDTPNAEFLNLHLHFGITPVAEPQIHKVNY